MRSAILSLVLGLGALGLTLAAPTQVKAEDHQGPAYTANSDTQLVHWRGGWGYGRSYYPGWGGYYGGYGGWGGYGRAYGGFGYYPYGGYGGYSSYYYPRYYGGYGYGYSPYSSFYYRPGFFW